MADPHRPFYSANALFLLGFSSQRVGVYVENTGVYSSFHGGCAAATGLLQGDVAM